MTSWTDFTAELDQWLAAEMKATLWWRDDDANEMTVPLETMLGFSNEFDVPLNLAVIPDGLNMNLTSGVNDFPRVGILQHGYSHENYASADEKKQELGNHRSVEEVCRSLKDGWAHLACFTHRLPVLVPPWNRISQQVEAELKAIGFSALSTFKPRQKVVDENGLLHVNTHVDVIDWKGSRGFVGEERCLQAFIDHLSARRLGKEDQVEPTGLLTHHLVHDGPTWAFLQTLFEACNDHEAAQWLTGPEVFGG